MKFSKFIIALIIVFNILFTAVCLFIFYKTGSEPIVLIGAWFGFTGGELWLLASIKKKEVEKEACEEVTSNCEQEQI